MIEVKAGKYEIPTLVLWKRGSQVWKWMIDNRTILGSIISGNLEEALLTSGMKIKSTLVHYIKILNFKLNLNSVNKGVDDEVGW